MMKKLRYLMATVLMLSMVFSVAACGGENAPVTPPPDENPTEYTATFMDRGTVVHTFKGKTGDVIVGPAETPVINSRYEFKGWGDFVAGDKFYSSDVTYNAVWHEQFGTDRVFTATKLRTTSAITLDGEKDDAYADAEPVSVDTVLMGGGDDYKTSAEVSMIWDDDYLYFFIDVTDSTPFVWKEGENILANDSVELFVDTLHNESLATDEWKAKLDAVWGDSASYRTENAAKGQCEGGYRIGAGVQFPQGTDRYNAAKGSEFTDEWMSNGNRADNETVGTTKLKEDNSGYTAEYKIKMLNSETKPTVGSTIGVGIKIYDRTDAEAAPAQVALESIFAGAYGPKKLSNVRLAANVNDYAGDVVNVSKVRDLTQISVDNVKDAAYVDSVPNRDYKTKDYGNMQMTTVGGAAINALWGNNQDGTGLFVHVAVADDATVDETDCVKIESVPVDPQDTSFDPLFAAVELKRAEGASSDSGYQAERFIPIADLATDSFFVIKITYTDGQAEPVSAEYGLKMKNDFNFSEARVRHTATQLRTGAVIAVDGEKDDAYADAVEIDISHKIRNAEASAKAYVLWDRTYLYVFVTVADAEIRTKPGGDPWECDYVEVCLDTWNNFPSSFAGGDYRGGLMAEGQYKVEPGGWSGAEWNMWMGDWAIKNNEFFAATARTEGGYTAEFKINYIGTEGEGYIHSMDESKRLGLEFGFRIIVNDFKVSIHDNNDKVTTNGIVAGHTNPGSYDKIVLAANPQNAA